MDERSTRTFSAARTAESESVGCVVLALERSPSTSRQGSVLLSWMCSGLPVGHTTMRPLPPCSSRRRIVLHLHVPRVVELAGLQHGARGGGRVAAALHLDAVEEGPVEH